MVFLQIQRWDVCVTDIPFPQAETRRVKCQGSSIRRGHSEVIPSHVQSHLAGCSASDPDVAPSSSLRRPSGPRLEATAAWPALGVGSSLGGARGDRGTQARTVTLTGRGSRACLGLPQERVQSALPEMAGREAALSWRKMAGRGQP